MAGLSDDSNSGLAEDSLKEAIRAVQANIHTMLPAEIVVFYPETQTADVQVCIKRNLNGVVSAVEVLQGLPVRFPRGGGYSITFPVKPGDPCEVRFCERSIDNWFVGGGCVDPADTRLHDLSDGVVDMGLCSSQQVLDSFDSSSFVIRSDDDKQTIKITSDAIALTSDKASAMLNNDGTFKFQGETDELITVLLDLITQTVAITTIIAGVPTPINPVSQAALNLVKARLQTLKA